MAAARGKLCGQFTMPERAEEQFLSTEEDRLLHILKSLSANRRGLRRLPRKSAMRSSQIGEEATSLRGIRENSRKRIWVNSRG
jgi:hypothetical protein